MEGLPKKRNKLEKVGETDYGPILKRESSFDDGDEREMVETGVGPGGYPEYEFAVPASKEEFTERELTLKERSGLRSVLFALGLSLTPMNDDGTSIDDVHSKSLANGHNYDTRVESESSFKNSFFTQEIEELSQQIDNVDLKETTEFANKPVVGHEDFTRLEFAKQAVEFRSEPDEKRNRPAVPDLLQAELKEKIPGWIAQESRFKGDAVSRTGATGIAQIRPEVWKEYTGTEKVSLRMDEQMKVFGELVSDNYHYILHFAGEDAIDKLRSKFDSEADFIRELMTPLMVNAYNAGGPLMGRIIKSFVKAVPVNEMKTGHDLFKQITDYAKENHAGYGKEQEEYVSRIYAFGSALKRNQA